MVRKEQIICKERNYGIDFLRIIAMIFIPILHVLGQGGILGNSISLSANYEVAWFLEIAAYCAVNCYALISGYVGYDSKYKFSNIIYLYFQVIFYTLIITSIFAVLKPETIEISNFVKAVFPFAFGTYWYFTAYFCMFFFMPFMNYFINTAPKNLARKMIFAIIILFSILPAIFANDMFKTSGGYSVYWLSMMYIIGAYIKKYGLNLKIRARTSLLGYFIFIIITWLSKLILDVMSNKGFNTPYSSNILVDYTSPTIVGASIMLLMCCLNMKLGKVWKKIISIFAPVAFGVYLIHVEPLIWNNIMKARFVDYLEFNPILMAIAVLGTALFIWFICSIIDKIRLEIFKILKIKQLSNNIENTLSKKFGKLARTRCITAKDENN
jgi:surface polysaccharide O-acyltransferase-like enzyme